MPPAGTWMHNPITGELATLTVSPDDTGGARLEAELWLQPNAAVLGEHVHSAITERFAVVEGRVGYRLDGVEGEAGPGEEIVIPVGARHDWWNAGAESAHVRFSLDSPDPAKPMAGRFLAAIEASFGLAAAGKTNAKGMPGPLWLASLAREYRDVMVLTRPPAAVQRALFAPLAAVARATGRNVADPSLHDERCPARMPAPDAAQREAILRVAT
jgi:quercetin dioxygenase-like cupin family protein